MSNRKEKHCYMPYRIDRHITVFESAFVYPAIHVTVFESVFVYPV
jgi:hypothetical protein